MNKDELYMKLALEEAKKAYLENEVPVGAVIVYHDKVLARSHNLRQMTNDITNHAELIAIREASQKINDWRLDDTTMYVTLFPCPMCAGAIVASRIKRLVVGTPTTDLKTQDLVLKILEGNNTSPKVNVDLGILESDCREILSMFFKKQRYKES
ncbi:MAG: nucleoside deaminase [Bacilli bacterium]|nr:nucleoside deaminase [Bacilli bacterium]